MSDRTERVWLITGASRGLGRAIAEVVLEAGDTVVATARSIPALDGLVERFGERVVPVALDVTDRAAVLAAVAEAAERTGRIDVLLNNAGYGLAGAVEEVNETQVRDQFDVNFFGALWVTQAVLPVMRRQGSGHLLQMSSIAGVTTYPNLGLYCASKWALEAVSETLAQEVAGFGVKVTLVEAGEFRTDWSAGSMVRATPKFAYDEVLAKRRHGLSGAYAHLQPGDPRKAGEALLKLTDEAEPPLRVLLGEGAADLAPNVLRARLAGWEEWDALARTTDFPAESGP
ncbi:oxidoreductase [Streptomyces lavendulae]|uniref:Oxygenase-like protein n=2 Tax=Streptomycetaceae TaxID=2062 RepID=Q93M01_KITAU|nr:oxidoreductase [Streptomyces lavendulae]AAK61715.1 oxygenase-like protein [Streptomyces lavendulae subsp. lavendulae]AIE41915.1 short-chain dehydrogenase [Streptomyces lavendulae subsp. lavendulae]ATZ29861.1 putative oxidoreductase [Streptomyces lavendulae subsp. lavendulae]